MFKDHLKFVDQKLFLIIKLYYSNIKVINIDAHINL